MKKSVLKSISFEVVRPFVGWEIDARKGEMKWADEAGVIRVNIVFRAFCPETPAVHGARGISAGQGKTLAAARKAARKGAEKWVQQSCAYFS